MSPAASRAKSTGSGRRQGDRRTRSLCAIYIRWAGTGTWRVHERSIKGQSGVHAGMGTRGTVRVRSGEATASLSGSRARRTRTRSCFQSALLVTALSPCAAECSMASGYPYRWFYPRPVRYTSVTTLTRRTTAAHDETPRDKEETARIAETSQLAGRLRR